MWYTNGFYLFRMVPVERVENEPLNFSHRWKFIKSVDEFHCYSFSYYLTNQLRIDFGETIVWMDDSRQLLIIFTRDEELLEYVFKVLIEKFQLVCIPYDLGIQSFLLHDGKSVITSLFNSSSSNKVITSLLRSDSERIQVIEKLINGDMHERNVASSAYCD